MPMGQTIPASDLALCDVEDRHFLFIKLLKQTKPQYFLSDEFSLLRQGNELYTVLSILRRLGELVSE
jgi:hypothetical protein